MGKFIDLRGITFNRLTVVARGDTDSRGNVKWWCLCECGELTEVMGKHLKDGHTRSCGCLLAEKAHETHFLHGELKTRLYRIWGGMKSRCFDINNKWYGRKGVTVCKEWFDFLPFKMWALENGYSNNLTIDRIDSNGNYEPSNCQWITQSENSKKMHTDKKTVGLNNG